MFEGPKPQEVEPPALRWPTDHVPAGQRRPRRWARASLVVPALVWIIGTPL